MVAAVLGFGLGGIIVEKLGVKVAFFIDALTFIISAVFIFSMKITDQKRFNPRDIVNLGRDAINKVRASFSCEIKEGFKYLFSSPETLYASKIFFALFSFVGALYVVFIVFIQNALDTITMDLGFLAIAIGLGLFVGTLLYGRLGHKARIEKVIPVVLFFSGIYLVSFAYILDNFPSMPFALISCFVLGLVVSPIVVAVNTLIHSGSDNNLWGRIFSSLEIIIHLSFIIFMFLASYLAELFSPFWVIVITGIAASIFAAINMIKLIYNDTPTRT
jgi:MFS family permease